MTIGFAALFYVKSLALSDTAARLPKLMIGVIIILALLMIIEGYFKGKKNPESKDVTKPNYSRTFVFTIMIALYIFSIKPLGYFVVTPIYILGTYIYLKSTTIRNNITISLGFTIFIYLLFVKFLKLPIPLGFML